MNLIASANIYWHLPVLIVVVSLVYSATRFERWPNILREALRWGTRMLGFLCGVALLEYVLTFFI
jgi:hypothetical protein